MEYNLFFQFGIYQLKLIKIHFDTFYKNVWIELKKKLLGILLIFFFHFITFCISYLFYPTFISAIIFVNVIL